MLKYVDEYRDAQTVCRIAETIRRLATRPCTIMEVCGGHTMAIRKNGLHTLLGPQVRLVSGPGCPVCVSARKDIDRAILLAEEADTAVCVFGDLFSVPGSRGSLAQAAARGRDVRVVYSVQDVLDAARMDPARRFIFISIGFETTTPSTALAIIQASREGISNFSVLCLNKTMPAALRAVVSGSPRVLDALLCPGHVSTITGTALYDFIPREFGVPCCVAGFEPVDILRAVFLLVQMHQRGTAAVVNAYERAVRPEGNLRARVCMEEVFEPADVEWRGFGVIPASGLRIREAYAHFDAAGLIADPPPEASAEEPGCRCAQVLRGICKPTECALFERMCRPEAPYGACMVSSEGVCAAWYRYGA